MLSLGVVALSCKTAVHFPIKSSQASHKTLTLVHCNRVSPAVLAALVLAAGKPPKGTIPLPPYTGFSDAKADSSCPSSQTQSAQDPPPDSQGPMCWWLSSSINPTGGPEPSHHCYIVPLAWFHPTVCLFRHHPLAIELAASSRERSLAGMHLLP